MILNQHESTSRLKAARKWFTLSSFTSGLTTIFINAPFGRFALTSNSWLLIDGRVSWVVMEVVAPIVFLYAYATSPLSYYRPSLPPFFSPQGILAVLYLVHYANRAVFSPMRTPSRSKSHVIVPLSGVCFNIINGGLLGAYLSSPYARIYLSGATWHRPSWWIGLGLWAAGLVGNVVHDEILLDIRRKAKTGKKDDDGAANGSKTKKQREGGEKDRAKGPGKDVETPTKGEFYGIPHGLLYEYISYPNYLCEWIEWAGFAIAAAPFPFVIPAPSALPSILFSLPMILISSVRFLLSPRFVGWIVKEIQTPANTWGMRLTPPWIFVLNEVALMLPRAWNGHKWYREKFGDRYPKQRKAVIPFVL